jgi:Leucine-rich repeat (LRR) protein
MNFTRLSCFLLAAAMLHGADSGEWIRKLGGKIEQDGARVDLSHTRISDEGLLHLRPARQIRELNLLYTEQITDLGLNAIKGWTSLKRLNVRGTRISDPTLAIIGKLPQLEYLDIANTNVTEAGLDSLVPLTKLRHLAMGRSRFRDDALAVLRLLTTLESLDLSGPSGATRNQRADTGRVPEALVQAVSELKELRTLKLGHSQISAAELRTWAATLSKMEKLGLEACGRIDDQALKVLAGWNSLKYVDLQDTKVTRQGIEELKKQRPDLMVLSGPFTASNPKT